jgi:effector-binding domain-containing protein
MQAKLEQTQSTIASLHDLLEGRDITIGPELRTIGRADIVAIRGDVEWDATEAWLTDALDELHAIADEAGLAISGPDGALYSSEFFELHEGEVIAFIPINKAFRARGRARPVELASHEYAITVHHGPFADIDRAYGALGTYVTERAIAESGPIRENYIVTAADTSNPAELRTEVCWPVRPRSYSRPADDLWS